MDTAWSKDNTGFFTERFRVQFTLILQLYASSVTLVSTFFEKGEGADSAADSVVVANRGRFDRREGEDKGGDVAEKEGEK